MMEQSDIPAEGQLVSTLLAGEFALTAEVVPPVSASAEDLLARAEPLRGLVDAINITDGPNAKVHMSAMASAAILAANGYEPVMQVTCRDRNRIALLSDLLGAAALGVKNLLLMRGDDPSAGSYPQAKAVFDVESLDLIRWARGMSDHGVLPESRSTDSTGGDASSGSPIMTAPQFFVGAAETPVDPPADWRPEGLKKKIDAGARFVQTQLCYDIDLVARYVGALREQGLTEQVFLLIGTGPIASARSARWMNENLWGVTVPEALIDRLDKAQDPKAEGVATCAEFLRQLADLPGVAGAHLMAPSGTETIPMVIDQAALPGRAT